MTGRVGTGPGTTGPGVAETGVAETGGTEPGGARAGEAGLGGRRVAVPRVVLWAALLLAVRITLGVLAAARQLSDGDPIRAGLRATNPTLDAPQTEQIYKIILVLGVGYGLLYAVLYGLLAVQLYRGRTWALPAARVVAGLGVLAGLGSLAGTAPFGRPLGVALLVLDAAALLLLSNRPARRRPAPARVPAGPPDPPPQPAVG
ncbi:MAG TPA: hypothetical protein VMU51_30175 [Mycobacteriales bacterium]|nr:hypothetical protein [Mycobacteriales bacterium]